MKVNIVEKKSSTPSSKLKQLSGGDVFCFDGISVRDAINENAVYMVTSGGKDGRCSIMNVADGMMMMRDDCHNVVKIDLQMQILF